MHIAAILKRPLFLILNFLFNCLILVCRILHYTIMIDTHHITHCRCEYRTLIFHCLQNRKIIMSSNIKGLLMSLNLLSTFSHSTFCRHFYISIVLYCKLYIFVTVGKQNKTSGDVTLGSSFHYSLTFYRLIN